MSCADCARKDQRIEVLTAAVEYRDRIIDDLVWAVDHQVDQRPAETDQAKEIIRRARLHVASWHARRSERGGLGRLLLVIAFLAAVVLALGFLVGDRPARSTESILRDHINGLRVDNGLRPLEPWPPLVEHARAWTRQMATDGRLRHSSRPGLRMCAWGQNVGLAEDAADLARRFEASADHRRNILDPRWTHVGIGYVRHEGSSAHFATEDFADLTC